MRKSLIEANHGPIGVLQLLQPPKSVVEFDGICIILGIHESLGNLEHRLIGFGIHPMFQGISFSPFSQFKGLVARDRKGCIDRIVKFV